MQVDKWRVQNILKEFSFRNNYDMIWTDENKFT